MHTPEHRETAQLLLKGFYELHTIQWKRQQITICTVLQTTRADSGCELSYFHFWDVSLTSSHCGFAVLVLALVAAVQEDERIAGGRRV